MAVDAIPGIIATYSSRIADYQLYRDYHAGRHRDAFASQKFRRHFQWVLDAARENLIPASVASHANRLRIKTWGDETAEALAAQLGLGRLARLVHDEMLLCGDAYTVVWYGRDGQPRPVFHRADQIIPQVDDQEPDKLASAAKLWIDRATGYGRITIYYPDRLERYTTTSRLADPKTSSSEPVVWPTQTAQWQPLDLDDAPAEEPHGFGAVPVCWWKCLPESQYSPGRSLIRDVIPPQDELNKLTADALVASERIALPLRYLLQTAGNEGQPVWDPAAGEFRRPQQEFRLTKDDILLSPAAGPAGEFPAPDAAKLVALQERAERKIARILGLPRHYFGEGGTTVASGESLRTDSARLASSIEWLQADATPVWRGLGQLLGLDITPQWVDPVPVDTSERLANAQTRQALGYAMEDAIREVGDPDPAGIVQRATAAQAASEQALGRALAAGRIPATY